MLRDEAPSASLAAAARSVVVCCATDGYGRQPKAAVAVQTRHHPDCAIVLAAGEAELVVRGRQSLARQPCIDVTMHSLTQLLPAGFGPIRSASDAVCDVAALVREMTPGALCAAAGGVAGSSQALTAGDSSLGACGVLLATVTVGFSGSQQQLRCLETVLAAAAAAGGAPV